MLFLFVEGKAKMKEKKPRKTTLVRVTLATKAKIDALCSALKWDQQTVVEEAVNHIDGKIEIKFKDEPKKEDDCPGHNRAPATKRTAGAAGFQAPSRIPVPAIAVGASGLHGKR